MDYSLQSDGKKGYFISIRQGIGIIVIVIILLIGACVLTASLVHLNSSSKENDVQDRRSSKLSFSNKSMTGVHNITTLPTTQPKSVLKGPSSCAEAKQCSPNATDGEYWLYPLMYGGEKKVKIYCHNMTAPDFAAEYLTIPKDTNYIIKHDINHVVNKRECTRNSKKLLKVNYRKVRLLINAMVVVGRDYRFTETEEGVYASETCLGFGEAADCSGHRWAQDCKRHGAFSIDLRRTGVAVDPSTRWMVTGYHAAIYNHTRSTDLTQIYCLVGGWCGKCVPEDVIRLRISDDKLEESKAKIISCK